MRGPPTPMKSPGIASGTAGLIDAKPGESTGPTSTPRPHRRSGFCPTPVATRKIGHRPTPKGQDPFLHHDQSMSVAARAMAERKTLGNQSQWLLAGRRRKTALVRRCPWCRQDATGSSHHLNGGHVAHRRVCPDTRLADAYFAARASGTGSARKTCSSSSSPYALGMTSATPEIRQAIAAAIQPVICSPRRMMLQMMPPPVAA